MKAIGAARPGKLEVMIMVSTVFPLKTMIYYVAYFWPVSGLTEHMKGTKAMILKTCASV